jgi:hypothetical protein
MGINAFMLKSKLKDVDLFRLILLIMFPAMALWLPSLLN